MMVKVLLQRRFAALVVFVSVATTVSVRQNFNVMSLSSLCLKLIKKEHFFLRSWISKYLKR